MPPYWIDEIRCKALTPTEADVSITVMSEDLRGGQELLGRLVGPRCEYSTTIEVAYRLQPMPRQSEQPTRLMARVQIPEPCFWEPETPFVYHGQVEVVRNGKCESALPLAVGLRTVQWRGDELRINGRPFRLKAVRREQLSMTECRQLRGAGINCVIAPVSQDTADMWNAADRFGFFVVGQLTDSNETYVLARSLRLHPSHLGWLPPIEMTPLGREPTDLQRSRAEWLDATMLAAFTCPDKGH